jgi:hypothetical protein
MSNPPYDRRASPLDPEMMSPAERLEEAASLLARGILRLRLRRADAEKKGLDVSPDLSDSCVMWLGPKGRHRGPAFPERSRQSAQERQTHEH